MRYDLGRRGAGHEDFFLINRPRRRLYETEPRTTRNRKRRLRYGTHVLPDSVAVIA